MTTTEAAGRLSRELASALRVERELLRDDATPDPEVLRESIDRLRSRCGSVLRRALAAGLITDLPWLHAQVGSMDDRALWFFATPAWAARGVLGSDPHSINNARPMQDGEGRTLTAEGEASYWVNQTGDRVDPYEVHRRVVAGELPLNTRITRVWGDRRQHWDEGKHVAMLRLELRAHCEAAQTLAELALGRDATGEGAAEQQESPSREEWLPRALYLAKAHPEWTQKRLAAEVGISSGHLGRQPEFKRYRQMLSSDPPPRGYITDHGVEASSG